MIQHPRRAGVALAIVLVCLALLSVMVVSVVRQGLAQKRFLDQREHRAQAYWLAQAGLEHAAARLQSSPAPYTGETLVIIPDSEVLIRVEAVKDRPEFFRITSDATYPKIEVERVAQSASRTIRVHRDKSMR